MTRSGASSRIAGFRARRKAHALAQRYEALAEEACGLDLRELDDAELDRRASAVLSTPPAEAASAAEAFGVLREVAHRTTGLRPYPVQVAAGLALLDGRLVEAATGEGKTLAAVIPAALLAARLGSCHIITFNDYLAGRDAQWMGPFYARLGLTIGVVRSDSSPSERRSAYRCPVTYVTAKEVGFDFLRDGLVFDVSARVGTTPRAAIVDEADSILIDEARIPLVIAGDREHSGIDPTRMADLVGRLEVGRDFLLEQEDRDVNLTEKGLARMEALLAVCDLHAAENLLVLTEVNQALHARALLARDVDYLVRDGEIVLVDELSGRVVPDRRWPDGLQAAIEAKEAIPVRPGGHVLGSITMRHVMSRYAWTAGMTATAQPAADEFEHGYGLEVVPLPPNRPCLRNDLPDLIFRSAEDKERALVAEIQRLHAKGRPILIGTASVEESDRIAGMLTRNGVASAVLNARNDREEAAIIARAGDTGAVTVSTNMAGRGTDIRLGGPDEGNREFVCRLGGLHVIGTNRHESRRIDDQLRGRAGRQGDPGSSQFFVSLEDPLMRRHRIAELIPPSTADTLGRTPTSSILVRREVERVQRIATSQNREIRGTTARYAELLELQRRVVAGWRDALLEGDLPEIPDPLDPTDPEDIELARRLWLQALDVEWADHLAFATDVREAVHLVRIGGKEPLNEFHRQIVEALSGYEERIRADVEARAQTVRRQAPPGPASTWTYLVSDGARGGLHDLLFGPGGGAFGAGAALMTWPLLLLWGFAERRRRRD